MSNQQTHRVDFFREAAPYIYHHRNKTFVIAIKDNLLEHENFRPIIQDIAILTTLGVKVVLVHGTRSQIDDRLQAKQHPIQLHHDLRITDKVTMQVVKEAVGSSRLELENAMTHILNTPPIINNSIGLLSGNFITAKPLGIVDGVDYQHTGEVRKINTQLIQSLLTINSMVLLSPIGYSPTGQSYNLRYESVAIQAAKALKADKLIFIHDTAFNLPDATSLDSLNNNAESLNPDYKRLLSDIEEALKQGVERIHLLDANQNDSLLLELYTRDGKGHLFSADIYETVRQATIDDVSGILELIEPLETKGILVKRSREQLELEVHNFTVIEREQTLIGCAACYTLEGSNMAELACLAIHPDYRSRHLGDTLLEAISQQAIKQQLTQLLVLTTHTTDWFAERGFNLSHIDALPDTRKARYNYQRNSKVLIKAL